MPCSLLDVLVDPSLASPRLLPLLASLCRRASSSWLSPPTIGPCLKRSSSCHTSYLHVAPWTIERTTAECMNTAMLDRHGCERNHVVDDNITGRKHEPPRLKAASRFDVTHVSVISHACTCFRTTTQTPSRSTRCQRRAKRRCRRGVLRKACQGGEIANACRKRERWDNGLSHQHAIIPSSLSEYLGLRYGADEVDVLAFDV